MIQLSHEYRTSFSPAKRLRIRNSIRMEAEIGFQTDE